MKTEFTLKRSFGVVHGKATIIGQRPAYKPYVSIEINRLGVISQVFIQDNDLEIFAVNILKALKSKRLKP